MERRNNILRELTSITNDNILPNFLWLQLIENNIHRIDPPSQEKMRQGGEIRAFREQLFVPTGVE